MLVGHCQSHRSALWLGKFSFSILQWRLILLQTAFHEEPHWSSPLENPTVFRFPLWFLFIFVPIFTHPRQMFLNSVLQLFVSLFLFSPQSLCPFRWLSYFLRFTQVFGSFCSIEWAWAECWSFEGLEAYWQVIIATHFRVHWSLWCIFSFSLIVCSAVFVFLYANHVVYDLGFLVSDLLIWYSRKYGCSENRCI